MTSFLEDSYLGSLANAEITVLPTVDGLRPVRPQGISEEQLRETAAMNRPVQDQPIANQEPSSNTVTLPGGIRMPKETFYVLLAAIVIIAVYYFTRKGRKP